MLVPGAGETSLDWLPILPTAAELSTVVALDRAGLGLSEPAPHVTVLSQVDDLAAVLAHTGPAVVVGHSWGGLLAQLVAWRQPESVLGLVLVDPSDEEVAAAIPRRLRVLVAAMGPALTAAHAVGQFHRLARPMARRLAELSTDDPRLRGTVEAAYLAAYRSSRQVRMIGRENRLGLGSVRAVRAARASVSPPEVPVVVLTATTGKRPDLQRRAQERHATLGRQIIVDGAGHYIHHDRPQAVVDAIAAVLSQARGSGSTGRR